ncbi:EI24 domain-containing protein [Caenimonas sp. SL110]|uniref:EI24 domain-containing protein n=1 Tax=Caenimonas sp. SL110 TaxID=1450524 RepID=UPI0006544AAF|nr:EI24 domain-containing protein [Caenimonas sp. SL110]
MNLLLDSFWRAVAYCLHPRVIALSFLPLAIMFAVALGFGYFFWEGAIEGVRAWLESSELLVSVWSWLQGVGVGNLKTVAAPLIVVFATTPVIVLMSLLFVAAFMGPALAAMVAERRFPQLEKKRGGSLAASIAWSLGSTLLALVAFIVSLPLWLIPPLVLVLPPLIWGWLTYRVMAFDALSEHASKDERRALFRRHRTWLLSIGVIAGFLGAAPSIVWASSALFVVAFVVLAPVAIWIYTLVFAFASLWFAHYCLAALEAMRAEDAQAAQAAVRPVSSPQQPAPVALPHDVPAEHPPA